MSAALVNAVGLLFWVLAGEQLCETRG